MPHFINQESVPDTSGKDTTEILSLVLGEMRAIRGILEEARSRVTASEENERRDQQIPGDGGNAGGL